MLGRNVWVEKMFPVVIGVKRKIVLFAPLPDSKTAGFLICKSDGPFLKMDLVKFLFCIHEMILLDKMNTNRANRANCTNSCLEMLLERLSQKCAKMNRY